MALPLMPKATAVWLVENTALTFEQISAFCGMHALEVQGIADGEVALGIQGLDPVAGGQLTREDLQACEADPKSRLTLAESSVPLSRRPSGPRYTPVSKRQDRPNAIAWLLRYHPDLSDAQVARLVGTTKPTIASIRERTHWNIQNIRPQDPISLGLCGQIELDDAIATAHKRQRVASSEPKAKPEALRPPKAVILPPRPAAAPEPMATSDESSGRTAEPTLERVFGPTAPRVADERERVATLAEVWPTAKRPAPASSDDEAPSDG
ncbi:MAG: DUF1013 domain-containing protein [Alphaproteobacteria bacterium]|nr:DUF1013 domain-containing protein [Alphaproteobacteria bacterium]